MPRLSPFLVAAVLLSGCAYTVEDLVRNDDLRERIIESCVKKGLAAKDDGNCRVAGEAQLRVTGKKIKSLF